MQVYGDEAFTFQQPAEEGLTHCSKHPPANHYDGQRAVDINPLSSRTERCCFANARVHTLGLHPLARAPTHSKSTLLCDGSAAAQRA